jgi:short-subunit dehydrogenase
MPNVLIIGGSGGIGSECNKELTKRGYNVVTISSKQLDLNYPDTVFNCNFSKTDILINCAGHTHGTYQGFLKNTWQNQLSQINVNYVSNLFLLKHFANTRPSGKYVWCSSSVLDQARPFHSVYASTKAGSKVAIDLIRQEATHIDILEVKFGLVKTNFRYNNFCGTVPHTEVNQQYANENALEADYVADKMVNAIESNLTEINIT